MKMCSIFALAVVLFATAASGDPRHIHINDEYKGTVEVVEDKIVLELEVKTTGMVGFGLNTHGKMWDGDFFAGGVGADGKPYSNDYHLKGTDNGRPDPDTKNDWTVISGTEEGGVTKLKIERLLDTKDEQDMMIEDKDMYMLWAFSPNDPDPDPAGKDKHNIAYHADKKRGPRQLNLFKVDDPTDGGGTGGTGGPTTAGSHGVITEIQTGVLLLGLAAAMFRK